MPVKTTLRIIAVTLTVNESKHVKILSFAKKLF